MCIKIMEFELVFLMNKNNSSHNPHKSPLVKPIFFYIVQYMKISKILLVLLCASCILPSFGQEKTDTTKDKDLYNFAIPLVDSKAVDTKTDDIKDTKDASLVADAETLIRDKLVQKYQVRLDEVIDRLTGRLGTSSASTQREALGDLKKTMSDRKDLVVARKDLDPMKRDLILALLDHVIYRIDGIIKQSAQMEGEKIKA